MPRPVYIVCAESLSHDRATGQLSLFHLVEGYNVHVRRADDDEPPELNDHYVGEDAAMFRVVATWFKEEGDDDQPYEWQLVFRLPGGKESTRGQGQFRFRRPFHRIQIGLRLQFALSSPSGVGDIIVRIRKIEGGEWSSQAYPFPVTVIMPPEADGASDDAADDTPDADQPPTKAE